MKVGDLVTIQTYRNSGDIEAIGIFMGYANSHRIRAFVHVNGTQQVLSVLLLEAVNESR